MLFVATTAIVGGVATAGALLPVGWLTAFVGAPVGGSLCGLLGAVALSLRRGPEWRDPNAFEDDVEGRTDAMVAALRGVAAQGRRAGKDGDPDRKNEEAA